LLNLNFLLQLKMPLHPRLILNHCEEAWTIESKKKTNKSIICYKSSYVNIEKKIRTNYNWFTKNGFIKFYRFWWWIEKWHWINEKSSKYKFFIICTIYFLIHFFQKCFIVLNIKSSVKLSENLISVIPKIMSKPYYTVLLAEKLMELRKLIFL